VESYGKTGTNKHKCDQNYSWRSATMGSTLVARRAGKNAAIAITTLSIATAARKEEMSPGPSPKSWLEIACDAA
jgi:hypothetical protein